jgi:ADP-ribosyltransferase exoenzyme
MTSLGKLLKTDLSSLAPIDPELFETIVGYPWSDAEVVAQVHSLTAAAGLHLSPTVIQTALHQDDDAHDTCSLTACLNPLHPGPCKGWKGTLFDKAPAAWHALEGAKVEKANATRLKKIEALKSAGKPIPYKLLQPIVAKPHPHAGQTANKASGGAHEAGKAVTESSGVHPNLPGKVSLGQAVKPMPSAPVAKGPKGKKPTLGSHGIAFVIAQEKVTPQYKLDKAAKITPEEWANLSEADQSTIRGELAKVKKDGFGPQQKKADELLAKLPAGAQPKAEPTKLAPGPIGVGAKPVSLPPLAKPTEEKVAKAKAAPTSADQAAAIKGISEAISGPQKMTTEQLAGQLDMMKAGNKPLEEHQGFPMLVNKLAQSALKKAAADNMPGLGHGKDEAGITEFNHEIADHIKEGKPGLPPLVAKMAAHHEAVKSGAPVKEGIEKAAKDAAEAKTPEPANDKIKAAEAKLAEVNAKLEAHRAKPKLTETYEPKGAAAKKATAAQIAQPEDKPKPPPAHVADAIAMAEGKAPGASWSKNHLAAYQKLSSDDFKTLPPHVQDKVIAELTKAQAKFLDPKKTQAAKDLIEKFKGAPKVETPKVPKVIGFGKDLHNHDVSPAEAKKVVAATPIGTQFLAAKQSAGLTGLDNPDNTVLHEGNAEADADALVHLHTKLYSDAVLKDPAVKGAVADLKKAAHDQAYAQSVLNAKQKAFQKIAAATKDGAGLSPIEKASLQHYASHVLEHENPKTDPGTMDKLKADTKAAENELTAKLHAALKQANAPAEKAPTPAGLTDHQKIQAVKAEVAKGATLAEAVKKVNEAPSAPTPAGLTDYDKTAVREAYAGAWGKTAGKAVLYGIKSYVQKEQMKAHSQYVPLTHDLGDLQKLAGALAVAHAEEHTASLNVPTDPETGALEPGPELKAWAAATKERQALESQFKTLHTQAQKKLDTVRAAAGLKKRSLPKIDSSAVKTMAAESGYYKSTGISGPNYGKPSSGKSYMLAKAGPKIAVEHKSPYEKQAEKLGTQTSSTSKIENAGPSGEPVKLGGEDSSIAHIPAAMKKQITADFKGVPKGKFLTEPAEDIFGNLVNLAAAHGKTVPGGLSIDQVLKTIDETHSKSLGVANKGMLHEKITNWLGTAAGKSYAEGHSTPDAKKVKQLTGEIDLPKGVALAPGEKVQKVAGPGPHDKSLPASAFHPHTTEQHQQEQDAYKKAQGIKWSAAQKKAMHAYTGNGASAYNGINNYLRGEGSYNAVVKQYAVDIQSAMMPLRENTLLKRGTGWPPGIAEYASHPQDLLGKTFEDKGFVSSSAGGSGGHFSGKPLQLVIEAPKGTPAVFVNGISQYKGTENEMLLAAGTKFKVISVDKTSGGHTLMRVRVVGDK